MSAPRLVSRRLGRFCVIVNEANIVMAKDELKASPERRKLMKLFDMQSHSLLTAICRVFPSVQWNPAASLCLDKYAACCSCQVEHREERHQSDQATKRWCVCVCVLVCILATYILLKYSFYWRSEDIFGGGSEDVLFLFFFFTKNEV